MNLMQMKWIVFSKIYCSSYSDKTHTDAGKSDQSAAGAAYDSLVNQLFTLMDGLRLYLTHRHEFVWMIFC